MATVTKPIIPGYSLTGNTVSPDSSPITYTVSTPSGSFGPLVGAQIANFRLVSVDANTTRVVLDDGAAFVIPNSSLSAFNSGITQAFSQIRAEIPKLVTTTSTNVTTGPEIVVTAPKKAVANTSDVPLALAADTGPIKVNSPPLVIDALGLDGKPTGEKIVIDPPGTGIPDTDLDPAILSIIDTPPLVDTASINAEIANIQFETPDFATDYSQIYEAESQATEQDQANFAAKEDWRVRLSLAPESQYLYNDPEFAGILAPLKTTDGVVFPYTPQISVNYAANYEQTALVHSNYKIFQYSGSAVEQVTIACDFACQDTFEANYVLAVIHFFRSMTKMFYGQDENPKNGTPPPLCYMFGMGGYQFANTSDVPLALAADTGPIKVNSPPLVIDTLLS